MLQDPRAENVTKGNCSVLFVKSKVETSCGLLVFHTPYSVCWRLWYFYILVGGLHTGLYWSTCTCRFGYFQQFWIDFRGSDMLALTYMIRLVEHVQARACWFVCFQQDVCSMFWNFGFWFWWLEDNFVWMLFCDDQRKDNQIKSSRHYLGKNGHLNSIVSITTISVDNARRVSHTTLCDCCGMGG